VSGVPRTARSIVTLGAPAHIRLGATLTGLPDEG
jgi:hypothetical protein